MSDSLNRLEGDRFGFRERGQPQPKGLTKREYFAAITLQGMFSGTSGLATKFMVVQSIKIADELMEQLQKTND